MSYKLLDFKDEFEKIRKEIVEENKNGPKTFYTNIEDRLMKTIEEMDNDHFQELTYNLLTNISINIQEIELSELTGIKNCTLSHIINDSGQYSNIILTSLNEKYKLHNWFNIKSVNISNASNHNIIITLAINGQDTERYIRCLDKNYLLAQNNIVAPPSNQSNDLDFKISYDTLFYNTFIRMINVLGHPATSNLILLFISYLYY